MTFKEQLIEIEKRESVPDLSFFLEEHPIKSMNEEKAIDKLAACLEKTDKKLRTLEEQMQEAQERFEEICKSLRT